MKVELYTDAGLKDNRATWAAVLVMAGAIVAEKSGTLREALDDTTTLELRAIANAIHWARGAGYLAGATSVLVHCDNSWAVGLLKGSARLRNTRTGKRHAATIARILKLPPPGCPAIKYRGVKGHQPKSSPDPKAPFNRRADELCRIERQRHD